MKKARLLFVDDETALLDGLRDLLRKERHRWEMTFSSSGEQALAQLAAGPFDIVVSDMRMPVMDGAQLLARVKSEHPGVARIILTGHADRDAVLRALPVAHQFLSKPCEASLLRSTLERTLELRRYLNVPPVIELVGRVEWLPSVPGTYAALTRAASNPSSGTTDLANIVEQDSAMSSKVLQWVNSAYFGSPQRVSSIRQAVNYLGIEWLKSIALSAHVFAPLEMKPTLRSLVEVLQDRATKVALLASRLLGEGKQAEEAFAAGLLQDAGKLVLASAEGPEMDLVGLSHAQIGAYLLGVWGLPTAIVEAVAYHDRPSLIGDGPCEVLVAAHVAGTLVDQQFAREGSAPYPLDLEFLERTGHRANLDRWTAMALDLTGQRGIRP